MDMSLAVVVDDDSFGQGETWRGRCFTGKTGWLVGCCSEGELASDSARGVPKTKAAEFRGERDPVQIDTRELKFWMHDHWAHPTTKGGTDGRTAAR